MILVYVLALWFLLLSFSDKNKLCALVILSACILNISFVDLLGMADSTTYTDDLGFLIALDGCTALALTTIFNKSKLAIPMSILLIFAIATHTMILYDLTISSSPTSIFFYNYYDELIISIGISQMVISYNELNSALRNIREHIQRCMFYCHCYRKGLFLHQKSRGRAS